MSETMTPREREIRDRLEKSTKGPFSIERRDCNSGDINYIVHGASDFAWCLDGLDRKAKFNAEFVKHSQEDIRHLLAQLTTAREIIEVAKAELKEECFCVDRSLPCDPCTALAKITEMEKEK